MLTLVVSSFFMLNAFAGQTPAISQQALIEAMAQDANNIVVLDVRSAEEFNEGHIKGAINVSHNTVEENLAKLTQYKDKKVVVYCRSGRRAGIAEHILAENGFTKLYHLTGDMNGWVAAKLPTVKTK
ncbi:rhodanese-like domain-containing protein [Litorilituus lipolyticus]|uniref:Rhodanese-like domain-containing protein n=2 Tax=Litorilituus lipolyticus TaxID=2491017 RepID=A0A502L4I0_9GAMM|nr:rhodanese-like domain-containing protein [Litorilituus lipolyticus]